MSGKMGKFIDLTGRRFGRLTVIERAESEFTGGEPQAVWRCHCDCGQESFVISANLRSGGTKSCGCLRREVMQKRAKIGALAYKEKTGGKHHE